jgi:hypothetical protein
VAVSRSGAARQDHAPPFTFTEMWMTKSFGIGGAAWHPGVTGHLAMAHSLAWYYSQVQLPPARPIAACAPNRSTHWVYAHP